MTWVRRLRAFIVSLFRSAEHDRVLSRADLVIAKAWHHADRVFYAGPERRKTPR